MTNSPAPHSADRVHQQLEAVRERMPDIIALAVVRFDGSVVATTLPASSLALGIGASAALVQHAHTALQAAACGDFYQAIVRGTVGYVLITSISPSFVLSISTGPSAKLGMFLLDIARVAQELLPLLETDTSLQPNP